eukprot:scaffold360_cov374-Pavlova_lutheri.AAC.38
MHLFIGQDRFGPRETHLASLPSAAATPGAAIASRLLLNSIVNSRGGGSPFAPVGDVGRSDEVPFTGPVSIRNRRGSKRKRPDGAGRVGRTRHVTCDAKQLHVDVV